MKGTNRELQRCQRVDSASPGDGGTKSNRRRRLESRNRSAYSACVQTQREQSGFALRPYQRLPRGLQDSRWFLRKPAPLGANDESPPRHHTGGVHSGLPRTASETTVNSTSESLFRTADGKCLRRQ